MQTEEIIIHIDWDGPHSLEAVSKLTGSTDFGIYQIYGTHPIYGSSVLLYIGLAADQTFAARFSQYRWCHNNPDAGRVEVYIGRLFGIRTPNNDTWCHHIALAERLLIYANQPAENAQKELKGLEPELRRVHVLNWHRYRDLLPEVSGACWAGRFADVHNYRPFNTDDLTQSAQSAAPKGGPRVQLVNSTVTEGPPSVS